MIHDLVFAKSARPLDLRSAFIPVDYVVDIVPEEELEGSAICRSDHPVVSGVGQSMFFDAREPEFVGLSVKAALFAGFLRPCFQYVLGYRNCTLPFLTPFADCKFGFVGSDIEQTHPSPDVCIGHTVDD